MQRLDKWLWFARIAKSRTLAAHLVQDGKVRVNRADGMAELRVYDHGPGIPDAEREDVFRPFHRFAGARDRGGTGLGLALVRQIARRHGGDARYLGRETSGSCFVVNLDASPSSAR